MNIAEKLTQIAQNEQKVYEAGAARHFKDYVRRCNAQQNFLNAFAGVGWRENATIDWVASYIPTKDMVFDCTINSANMYYYSGVTDTVATIDLSRATGNARSTFVSATKLVTIRKLLISETTPRLDFTNCSKLENITVEGTIGASWNLSSSPLTSETVQHLIDHLADLTGATTQTLTLKSTVGAALTDEQKAAISAKNWTLAY